MALIGFDARSVRKTRNGLGRTAHSLLKKLAELDKENRYIVFQRCDLAEPLIDDQRFRTIHVGYDIASLQNQFLFGRFLKKLPLDLYHSLNAFLPGQLPARTKSVVTIHDFNWLQRPSLAAPTAWRGYCNGIYGRYAHTYSVSRANHIVCVSNRTRDDLRKLFPGFSGAVTTIHHGCELDGESIETCESVRNLENRRYILSVGNGRPYKNPETTVKAFIDLKKDPVYSDVLLVVVGRGDSTSALKKLVLKEGVHASVRFLGLVTDTDLRFLYRRAEFLSFPSRWEGFGLPVVEAFASGCPVLASAAGSLPEICNGSAYTVNNPESVDEISQAFRTLLNDFTLRFELKKKGLDRAKAFKWESAAARYLSVYQDVLYS